jgi:iron(III) transport system substrate-binding protein
MATIKKAAGGQVKPIALDDKLLDGLDQTKRLRFLKDWSRALKGQ